MLIPLWVKATVLAGIVGSLVAGGYYLKGVIAENKQMKEDLAEFKTALEQEQSKNRLQDRIFLRRDELKQDVRDGIADVTVRIKQEAANDPSTRSFTSTVLPRGLRDAILKANAATAERASANGSNTNRRAVQDKH
ncbi:MAG: hypothetical protein V4649_19620 [Bacteroidota bacterium]